MIHANTQIEKIIKLDDILYDRPKCISLLSIHPICMEFFYFKFRPNCPFVFLTVGQRIPTSIDQP